VVNAHLSQPSGTTRAGRRIVPLSLVAVGCLLGLLGSGCAQHDRTLQLHAQLDDARAKVERLEEDAAALQNRNAALRQQVETLQGLGGKRKEWLFRVERIALGRYTGGVDLDGRPGDDAVKVFVEPIDQHGSVLKAAGAVKVQLFDLAAAPAENLIFEHTWPVETIHDYWSGGLFTNHYAFECRWDNPPRHDEVTVRVEFLDYFTGERFTAQKLCKVKPPPPPETGKTAGP